MSRCNVRATSSRPCRRPSRRLGSIAKAWRCPDGETIVTERFYQDKDKPDVLHDEVTVEDHALTRPWTVLKSYRRNPGTRPFWREVNCAENNNHVELSGQSYMLSADGLLMPTKKDQPPPDLRYFGRAGK